jgi:ubiquinone/menaquinone biosynthesis C-methylase UbiE
VRRWLYRPDRLADRFVQPGDRVLDFGCGPGFFTRAFATRVGDGGRVWAVDLQQEMLDLLRAKLEPEGLMPRVATHRCRADALDLAPDLQGTFDAAFAIFCVHEVPDPARLFREIAALLRPGGTFFYTDPFIVVSGQEFRESLDLAEEAGLAAVERSLYFLNRAAVLRKQA